MNILVIGPGNCGLVAALASAEQGAVVLIVEKEKDAGGNTSLSQALIPFVGFSGTTGPSGYLSANGLMSALILGKIAGEHGAVSIKQEN